MTRMLGRYELVRPLARGGMAEVYLARRRVSGGVEKRLVVKCIRRERSGDPRFIDMFVQEARLSMALTHKNIVPVFDFGRVDDQLFLVMDYIHGADLGALLAYQRARGEHLDPVLAAHIAMEACEALDYAHQLAYEHGSCTGIVHRDVTPGNVLLSSAGEIKLSDFGVAAAITELDIHARIRGTPAYMAPEQARAEPVDGRTDVFSLGLVLWEALAGRRAYDGADVETLLGQARSADIPALPARIPDELRAIVLRATARSPDQRYADARAMQVALDGFLVGVRARTGALPPSHRLAHMVARVVEERAERGGHHWLAADGQEDEDSAWAAMSSADDRPGALTLRSMAATVGDESLVRERPSSDGDADFSADADSDAHVVQPASRWRRLVPAAALGLAILAAVSIARPSGPSHPAASPDSRVGSSVTPDAGPDAAHRRADPVDTATAAPERRDAGNNTSVVDEAFAKPAASAPPRRAERARPSRRRTALPPAMSMGTLKISATPWAQVTVAGHDASCAETPCVLRLPEGEHSVHLVNPVARLQRDVPVRITRDHTLIITADLTAP